MLLANADLSPGAILQIGSKKWNVVEYQRQIHNALRNWDPTNPATVPLDADGQSMVFTWRAIKNKPSASNRRISYEFDDRAILDAGLHPTQTECVSGDAGDRPATSRWRNGALTMQLVKKSYFLANSLNPAIAMVDIQAPTDLPPYITTKEGDRVYTSIDYDDNLYETVGGLLAKNNQEHIWESTVFWHFGDLADLAGLGRPCYGEAGWEAAVAFELSNDPISATLEALDYDLTSDTLAAAVEALRLQGCDVTGASCNGEWSMLKSILDISKDYVRRKVENAITGPAPIPDQLPVIVIGGGESAITEGSDYEPGRMSWTDIVN